jgi:hypothetical protein
MSLHKPPLVVGIVGDAASGKDRVASIFAAQGYAYYSTGDIVREEIVAKKLRTSRGLQTVVANELRAQRGGGYFVEAAISRLRQTGQPCGKIVLAGLYAPCEGTHITEMLAGYLVGVIVNDGSATGEQQTLYRRLTNRADGARDQLDEEAFSRALTTENSGQTETETNVAALRAQAQFVVRNPDGAEDQFLIDQVISIRRSIETV